MKTKHKLKTVKKNKGREATLARKKEIYINGEEA
jgi:hypothetical protein